MILADFNNKKIHNIVRRVFSYLIFRGGTEERRSTDNNVSLISLSCLFMKKFENLNLRNVVSLSVENESAKWRIIS